MKTSIIDLKSIAQSESIEDVIKFILRNGVTDSRTIDKFFSIHNREVIDTYKIWAVLDHMLDSKQIAINERGWFIQGENWTEPAFMKEGKYGIPTT